MEKPPVRMALDGLVLRRELVGDEELIARTVANNLEHLSPWMPWATPEAATTERQAERLLGMQEEWETGASHTFLLLDATENTMLGVLGLHRRIGPGAIELGYWLAQDATGKGYVTTAARALTTTALQLDDVERVEIHCDEANTRSRLVPGRLGYRLDRVEDDGIQAPAEVGRGMVWVYPP